MEAHASCRPLKGDGVVVDPLMSRDVNNSFTLEEVPFCSAAGSLSSLLYSWDYRCRDVMMKPSAKSLCVLRM